MMKSSPIAHSALPLLLTFTLATLFGCGSFIAEREGEYESQLKSQDHVRAQVRLADPSTTGPVDTMAPERNNPAEDSTIQFQEDSLAASGVEVIARQEVLDPPAPPIRPVTPPQEVEPAQQAASPQEPARQELSAPQPSDVKKIGDWYIQVGVYKNSAEANLLSQAYVERGESVLVKNAMVEGINYTRVLVGPYRSLGSASNDLARVSSLGLSKQPPFYRKLED